MFPRPFSPCFSLKMRLFCSNQGIFVGRLPIKFFYFEDFRWSFFGKMIGQKQQLSSRRKVSIEKYDNEHR